MPQLSSTPHDTHTHTPAHTIDQSNYPHHIRTTYQLASLNEQYYLERQEACCKIICLNLAPSLPPCPRRKLSSQKSTIKVISEQVIHSSTLNFRCLIPLAHLVLSTYYILVVAVPWRGALSYTNNHITY